MPVVLVSRNVYSRKETKATKQRTKHDATWLLVYLVNHCPAHFHWELWKCEARSMEAITLNLFRQLRFMCPHFIQPRQSPFAFMTSSLSAMDFFGNCLHTSKSWGALHREQVVVSGFFSFLLLSALLCVTLCELVTKTFNLGGFLLLKLFDFRPLSGSPFTTSPFWGLTVIVGLQAVFDSL